MFVSGMLHVSAAVDAAIHVLNVFATIFALIARRVRFQKMCLDKEYSTVYAVRARGL